MKLALGSLNGFNQLQQSLGISMISGRNAKSHQHDICTKDNDHAKDEKFRGCGPSHLEQFTSHSANCNYFPTFARHLKATPVWLIGSMSEDYL